MSWEVVSSGLASRDRAHIKSGILERYTLIKYTVRFGAKMGSGGSIFGNEVKFIDSDEKRSKERLKNRGVTL